MRGHILLDRWLKKNVPNVAEWSREIGVDPTQVCHMRRGRRAPTLPLAFAIQDATGNEVPARSWV